MIDAPEEGRSTGKRGLSEKRVVTRFAQRKRGTAPEFKATDSLSSDRLERAQMRDETDAAFIARRPDVAVRG